MKATTLTFISGRGGLVHLDKWGDYRKGELGVNRCHIFLLEIASRMFFNLVN